MDVRGEEVGGLMEEEDLSGQEEVVRCRDNLGAQMKG